MIHIYTDPNGAKRVETYGSLDALASFLEQDVQSSTRFADEILSIVEELRRGDRSTWEATGNAHTVSLTRSTATIENEFTGESCELDLATFAQAVSRWRAEF